MKSTSFIPTIIKSMFYQANWNIANMQGTGFVWLLKDLFRRNGVPFSKVTSIKSSDYFNTNPYLITFILGMALKQAQNNIEIDDYSRSYSSALAALGDSFFWHSLRPFTFFAAYLVSMEYPFFSVIFYLILYNTFHLGFRFLGFYFGYTMGKNTILIFRRIAFNRWTSVFDSVSVLLAGMVIAGTFKHLYSTGSFIEIKAVILFAIGLLAARKVPAPIGLIIISGMLGLMLVLGV